MPLTPKGKKIQAAMKKQYGSRKGVQVFNAAANKGTVKGVKKKAAFAAASSASISTPSYLSSPV